MVLFDFCLGLGAYSLVSLLKHYPFSWYMVYLTVLMSVFPDGDFSPYFILRKWLKLVSHRQIAHYPGLYVIALYILWYMGFLTTEVTLYISAGLTVHFGDDLFCCPDHEEGEDWGLALLPGLRRLSIEDGRLVFRRKVPDIFLYRAQNTTAETFKKEFVTWRLWTMTAERFKISLVCVAFFAAYLAI